MRRRRDGSAHLHRVWHRHVVAIALHVPGDCGRLRVAAIVRGASEDSVLPGAGVPLEIPLCPGPRDVRLAERGRRPRGSAVEAVLDTADAAERCPGEATYALMPRRERCAPWQRDRALDRLLA